MSLRVTRDDRIAAGGHGPGTGRRAGWALCSLLVHGTALGAVLIAAAGEGPQLPPPAIEVTVVAAPAPPGAAATAAPKAHEAPEHEPAVSPSERESDPIADLIAVADHPSVVSDPEPLQPQSRPRASAEIASERTPPPPGRKPDRPERTPAAQATDASDALSEPAPVAAAQPAQLAALPEAESVDSAAPPGAGVSQPPRYEAGGEANPWPRYPAAARRRGIEGEVLLRVAVGLDGRAERVEIVRSSGSALLDKAAVEALERWRFEPARAAGQPVAATVEIPVTFRLTEPGGS
jgi:protein TonB